MTVVSAGDQPKCSSLTHLAQSAFIFVALLTAELGGGCGKGGRRCRCGWTRAFLILRCRVLVFPLQNAGAMAVRGRHGEWPMCSGSARCYWIGCWRRNRQPWAHPIEPTPGTPVNIWVPSRPWPPLGMAGGMSAVQCAEKNQWVAGRFARMVSLCVRPRCGRHPRRRVPSQKEIRSSPPSVAPLASQRPVASDTAGGGRAMLRQFIRADCYTELNASATFGQKHGVAVTFGRQGRWLDGSTVGGRRPSSAADRWLISVKWQQEGACTKSANHEMRLDMPYPRTSDESSRCARILCRTDDVGARSHGGSVLLDVEGTCRPKNNGLDANAMVRTRQRPRRVRPVGLRGDIADDIDPFASTRLLGLETLEEQPHVD